MMIFAFNEFSCLNWIMKNTTTILKDKFVAKYLEKNSSIDQQKSTNINVLLNRVKKNQKNESRKKLYFSAAASTGLVLFAFAIF